MIKLTRQVLTASLLVFGFASLAQAQATRTWVSGVGDDANPCSRTAPGKTFAGAISKTAAGGEISVLDPGGFGAVTITKAMTINGTASLGSILSTGGTNAVVVNAGPNDVVILRHLSINGAGTGLNGIRFLAGKMLIVDHCDISGFTGSAIDVSLSASGRVVLLDTAITNAGTGLRVSSTGGTVTASLKDCTIQGAGTGIDALYGDVTANHSTITGSTGVGANANGGNIGLEDCMLTFNGTGLAAYSGSSVNISNVDIFSNNLAMNPLGGHINTAHNNRVIGNTAPSLPPVYSIPVQ